MAALNHGLYDRVFALNLFLRSESVVIFWLHETMTTKLSQLL